MTAFGSELTVYGGSKCKVNLNFASAEQIALVIKHSVSNADRYKTEGENFLMKTLPLARYVVDQREMGLFADLKAFEEVVEKPDKHIPPMLALGGANSAMRNANMPKIPEGIEIRLESGEKDGESWGGVGDLASLAPERVYRMEVIAESGAVKKRLTAVYDMQFARSQSKGTGAWIYYRDTFSGFLPLRDTWTTARVDFTTARAEFQNGDAVSVELQRSFEALSVPFEVSPGVSIPVGGYDFNEAHLLYNFGPQRHLSANVGVEYGQFYNGTRTGLSASRGRVQITPQLLLEPGLTLNLVKMPEGDFTSTLLTTRATYTMTPRMSASALMQYNSAVSSLSTNIRFRWEYQPGSDLFVVLTDNRDTIPTGFPELRNRALIVKFTKLFRL